MNPVSGIRQMGPASTYVGLSPSCPNLTPLVETRNVLHSLRQVWVASDVCWTISSLELSTGSPSPSRFTWRYALERRRRCDVFYIGLTQNPHLHILISFCFTKELLTLCLLGINFERACPESKVRSMRSSSSSWWNSAMSSTMNINDPMWACWGGSQVRRSESTLVWTY